MGCSALIVVVGGGHGLLEAARSRIEDLEARWSRFRPSSELSLLNGLPSREVVVSPETFELVTKSVFAWEATAGAFDPSVLSAVAAAGYGKVFAVAALDSDTPRPHATRAPGCSGIVLDPDSNAITIPYGVGLDPGGIGKGLAGDIVVRELLAAGAGGAMVDLGGDVRVAGTSPQGEGWTIGVADPMDAARDITQVSLVDGAIATSSTQMRTWQRGDETVHHLIDPMTGDPHSGPTTSVTVVAGEGWWAEISTKQALAVGPDSAAGCLLNAEALFVDSSGTVAMTPGFEELAA